MIVGTLLSMASAQEPELITRGGLPKLEIAEGMLGVSSNFAAGIPTRYQFLYQDEAYSENRHRKNMPFTEIRFARSSCLLCTRPSYEMVLNVDGSVERYELSSNRSGVLPLRYFAEVCWAIERLKLQDEKRHGDVIPHDGLTTTIRLTKRNGDTIQISDFGHPFTIEFSLVASHIEYVARKVEWTAEFEKRNNNAISTKSPSSD